VTAPRDSAASGREPFEGRNYHGAQGYRDRRDLGKTGSVVVTALCFFFFVRIAFMNRIQHLAVAISLTAPPPPCFRG